MVSTNLTYVYLEEQENSIKISLNSPEMRLHVADIYENIELAKTA